MNSDFEKQIQQQPIRKVPADWRAEILRNAKSVSVSRQSEEVTCRPSWWREWLWPYRHAWTGMAALWLLMLGMNFGCPKNQQNASVSATPAMMQAMEEQRRLLAELIPPTRNQQAADSRRRRFLQPRSELIHDWKVC